MSIVYNSVTIANLSMDLQLDIQGLGHGRIVAAIRVQHTNYPRESDRHPRVIHFSGSLSAAGGHVADLTQRTLVWFPVRDEDTLHMSATVTLRSFEILNEMRKTPREDVQFICKLQMNLDGERWEQHAAELRCRVPASDWITLLEGLGYGTFALVEVPTGGVLVPAEVASATVFYKSAVEKLARCDWDGAVADARQVYDAIRSAIGSSEVEPSWAEFAQPPQRSQWTFSQRMAALRMMARHMTHLVHHGGTGTSPGEARYVVGIAGLILKFYGDKLRS